MVALIRLTVVVVVVIPTVPIVDYAIQIRSRCTPYIHIFVCILYYVLRVDV